MAAELSLLLSPGRIGSLEVRNRIVMPGMGVFLGDPQAGGALSEEQIEHWAARARGGAGLVFVEVTPVTFPAGATTLRQPGLSAPEHQARFKQLAGRVHAEGGALGVQLVHHGKVALADVAAGRPLLVPSANAHPTLANDLAELLTPDELGRMVRSLGGKAPQLREATEEDLSEVVDSFGRVALRAREAGLDCVEVHAAHGYLISSFLSPAYNRRTDEWGGPLVNRARLLCDVVRSIKGQAGGDFPVTVRIDGTEFRTPDGITLEEACETARLAEAAGADAIHVSAYADPTSGVGFTDAPIPWREGQYLDLAAAVRRRVGVPVIAVGRLNPTLAERTLREKTADFIAMGRQLLADPELPNKARRGQLEMVRPCINCFVCVATPFFDEPVSCTVNGHLGRQATTPIQPSPRTKRTVVVGAGPAGLEFARIAARRGHEVVVLEKSDRVGGTALLSGVVMPLNAGLARFLERDARYAGADIRTGVEATPQMVKEMGPDLVVVATGPTRARPSVQGADLPHVWSGDDLRSLLWADDPDALRRLPLSSRLVLQVAGRLGVVTGPERVRSLSKRWLPLGRRIVIVGGGLVGLELAEFLAERKRMVTVIEEGPFLGAEMAHPRRARILHELERLGVTVLAQTALVSIDRATVKISGQGEETEIASDDVVLASGTVASTDTVASYEAAGLEVRAIGDAAEVGYLYGAIRSGFDLARNL